VTSVKRRPYKQKCQRSQAHRQASASRSDAEYLHFAGDSTQDAISHSMLQTFWDRHAPSAMADALQVTSVSSATTSKWDSFGGLAILALIVSNARWQSADHDHSLSSFSTLRNG